MKRMTMNLILTFLFGFSFLSSALAQADHGGNGGDPNELAEFDNRFGEHLTSWYEVKTDLIEGFTDGKYLELHIDSLDPGLFKTKVLNALRFAKVEFKDERIVLNGVDRVCKNFIENEEMHIQCDAPLYIETMKQVTAEDQYRLIAHEYFGVAGVEPNAYGISDYPFSSQIAKSISAVMIKKWAIHNYSNNVPGIQCVMTKGKISLMLQARNDVARLVVLRPSKKNVIQKQIVLTSDQVNGLLKLDDANESGYFNVETAPFKIRNEAGSEAIFQIRMRNDAFGATLEVSVDGSSNKEIEYSVTEGVQPVQCQKMQFQVWGSAQDRVSRDLDFAFMSSGRELMLGLPPDVQDDQAATTAIQFFKNLIH